MELNLSSGCLNRSRGQVTRVPEEVDPGRAVARTADRVARRAACWLTALPPQRPQTMSMSGLGSIGPTSASMPLLACWPPALRLYAAAPDLRPVANSIVRSATAV
jgi:hypothetical protein